MFRVKDFISDLKRIKDMSEKERKRTLHDYFSDNKDFFGWMFNPPENSGVDITKTMTDIYDNLSKKKVVRAIVDMLDDSEIEDFDRTTATILFSLVRFGFDAVEAENKLIMQEFDKGQLSKSDKNERQAAVRKYMDLMISLNDYCNKMVKREAKKLSHRSGIDRDLCIAVLKTVPKPAYINHYKVGTFLNIVLNELYSNVDTNFSSLKLDADEDDKRDNWDYKMLERADWDEFFNNLFGKENGLEVATFILLEGIHRIKNFKSKHVREIWDSLTHYALKKLEKSDNGSRQHMLDLYIKRIAKMFRNGFFELRVDLRDLDDSEFPNLVKSVGEYKSKIKDIMTSVKESD